VPPRTPVADDSSAIQAESQSHSLLQRLAGEVGGFLKIAIRIGSRTHGDLGPWYELRETASIRNE